MDDAHAEVSGRVEGLGRIKIGLRVRCSGQNGFEGLRRGLDDVGDVKRHREPAGARHLEKDVYQTYAKTGLTTVVNAYGVQIVFDVHLIHARASRALPGGVVIIVVSHLRKSQDESVGCERAERKEWFPGRIRAADYIDRNGGGGGGGGTRKRPASL